MAAEHNSEDICATLFDSYVVEGNHEKSDYFGLIKKLLELNRGDQSVSITACLDKAYRLVQDEIENNRSQPTQEITFGTSGWRGVLGKDIFIDSVRAVTAAIVALYQNLDSQTELAPFLGVSSLAEAKQRGCLVGYDNRFGGELLGREVADYLSREGFKVYFCGETTTGVLSAALLELNGAFSINLTPSHNPLEYGGYKYNAADAGPAASELTGLITKYSRSFVESGLAVRTEVKNDVGEIIDTSSLALWQRLVEKNRHLHGIDYRLLCQQAAERDDLLIVIDSVHGASRLHIEQLLGPAARSLVLLRKEPDVTFGGVAPEPSSENLKSVLDTLSRAEHPLKIGAIIDPDGDRIRFTDGTREISMNQFGAMAYYFLHEYKKLNGMVAKTVATSNLANSVANQLGEEIFEPKVGFKEFKPVIGEALVLFEESDGISIIGHTPEKDAYIGLLLALDMVVSTGKNLGMIQQEIEERFGAFFPDRDGVEVKLQGESLLQALEKLNGYVEGSTILVDGKPKRIKEVISIDGRKMILEDDSWLMIRPSGTEPKVRFYVESRDQEGTRHLVDTARAMLEEAGV